MRPLYIFDLDGTLALCDHRRHFVENRANRWDEFYAACVDDTPNHAVIGVMRALELCNAEIYIFSGRSDAVFDETIDWLNKHVSRTPHNNFWNLTMRKKGNFTADDVLKKKWYDELSQYDKDRLVATFDDRDRIVAMWRSLGITCFQVAPGNF